MGRKGKFPLLPVILIAAAVIIVAFCIFLVFHPVFLKSGELTAELGSEYDFSSNISFVAFGSKEDVRIDGDVDFQKCGDYSITYKFKNYSHTVQVSVKDTTPPELTLLPSASSYVGTEIDPGSLVESVSDLDTYTLSLQGGHSYDAPGTYTVTVVAEDASGNMTAASTELTILEDTAPPVISGVQNYTITIDETLDFAAGVTVTDDHDSAPALDIDSSQVDFAAAGTYTVTYTATDKAGNSSQATCTVTVKGKDSVPAPTGSEHKVVYLTFDDGPSANMGKILDVLAQYGVKATFFVTGASADYRDMITRAYNEGHAIGLHSYTHNYSQIYASVDAFLADMQQISDLVESLTGQKTYLLRFPGGSSNNVSKKYCTGIMTALTAKVTEMGYAYFDWNADSTDASGNNVPVDQIVKGATASSANVVNILLHSTDTKDTTVQALPQIIEYYRSQGYTFEALTTSSTQTHHGVNN